MGQLRSEPLNWLTAHLAFSLVYQM